MGSIATNPFTPVEIWDDTRVVVKDGDENKHVDAKHYHVRYMVGESKDKRFVDAGKDEVDEMSERTIHLAPSIHRMMNEPFHYDVSSVTGITGSEDLDEKLSIMRKAGQCDDHELIEVAFQSPGVECCAMTKDDADKQQVPVQYLAGYLLGKKDGFIKVALSKTVLSSGEAYYENIHIIPEAIVHQWSCLEK